MPEQLDTKILPLLPLASGVVLPHMVVTLTLETAEARASVAAARSADDTLLLSRSLRLNSSVGEPAAGGCNGANRARAGSRIQESQRPNRACG